MRKVALHQRRNEYGRLVRKAYENHTLESGGRSQMQDYIPRTDGKLGTLTTVEKDNYVLVYEEIDYCK